MGLQDVEGLKVDAPTSPKLEDPINEEDGFKMMDSLLEHAIQNAVPGERDPMDMVAVLNSWDSLEKERFAFDSDDRNSLQEGFIWMDRVSP
jgi:hypothetical protein